MFELIFTSAPKGLFPGKSGFSTVAMTAGMPSNMVIPLENLSGYNFTYQGSDLPLSLNPACCYFIKMRYGNKLLPVIGRVAPNGLDHSRRNNKIAHHILLESPAELICSGGAADLFLAPGSINENSTLVQNGTFVENFMRTPCELAARRLPVISATPALPAQTWQQLTGDSGTAAMIAQRFITSPKHPIYVQYPPETPCATLLQLIREVASLLPDEAKRDFTFTTYASNLDGNTDCFLRCVPAFSPLLSNLKRFHSNNLIELGSIINPELLQAYEASEMMLLARTGQKPIPKVVIDEPQANIAYAIPEAVAGDNDDDLPPPPPDDIPQAPEKLRLKTDYSKQVNYRQQNSLDQNLQAKISSRQYISSKNKYVPIIVILFLLAIIIAGAIVLVTLLNKTDEPQAQESAASTQSDIDLSNIIPPQASQTQNSGATAEAAETPSENSEAPAENSEEASETTATEDANTAAAAPEEPTLESPLPDEEPGNTPPTQRTVGSENCKRTLVLGSPQLKEYEELPPGKALDLFIALRRIIIQNNNKNNFSKSITLPDELLNTVEIFVEFKQIGGFSGEELRQIINTHDLYYAEDSLSMKISSATHNPNNETVQDKYNKLLLEYSESENSLSFIFYKSTNGTALQLNDIAYLYFRVIDPDGEKLYRWEFAMQDPYIEIVRARLLSTLQINDHLECSFTPIPELEDFIKYKFEASGLNFTLNLNSDVTCYTSPKWDFTIDAWNADLKRYADWKKKHEENFGGYSTVAPKLRGIKYWQPQIKGLEWGGLDSFETKIINYIRSFQSIEENNRRNTENNYNNLKAEIGVIIAAVRRKLPATSDKKNADDAQEEINSKRNKLDIFDSACNTALNELSEFYEKLREDTQERDELIRVIKDKSTGIKVYTQYLNNQEIKDFLDKYFNYTQIQSFDENAMKKLLAFDEDAMKKLLELYKKALQDMPIEIIDRER